MRSAGAKCPFRWLFDWLFVWLCSVAYVVKGFECVISFNEKVANNLICLFVTVDAARAICAFYCHFSSPPPPVKIKIITRIFSFFTTTKGCELSNFACFH